MVTLIALYRHPDNVEEFLRHYNDVHIPLVQQMPGIQGIHLTRFTHQADGAHSPYLMMAEMEFLDNDGLKQALNSDAGRQAGRDLTEFAKDIVTLLVGQRDSSG
jgi:uncharacterized protein (TIGR02118 family)